MECYCKSKKKFEECCEPFLSGDKKAPSAEQLMRSRYSAYVLGNGFYIVNTTSKEARYEDDIALIVVEFKAYYEDNDGIHVQHERSNFIFEDGIWLYKDGKLFDSKIERNILCPCQSGKKYKKCMNLSYTPDIPVRTQEE